MKRLWPSWITVIATVAMISPFASSNLNGQQGYNTYQNVLNRAGYSNQYSGFANQNTTYGGQFAPAGWHQPTQDVQGTVQGAVDGFSQQPAHPPVQHPAQVGGFDHNAGYVPMSGNVGIPGNGAAPVAGSCDTGCAIPHNFQAQPHQQHGLGVYQPMAPAGGGCAIGDCGGNGLIRGAGGHGFMEPIYQAGRRLGLGRLAGGQGGNFNRVVAVRGLFFERDNESHYSLSTNPSGDRLYTTDADHGSFGGFDISLQSRGCNNRGRELRYWGLFPDQATATLAGSPVMPTLNWNGLQYLDHSGYTVLDSYSQGETHTITRDSQIHSAEYNFLSNVGCFRSRRGRSAQAEFLAGFRYFQFNEDLAFTSTTTAAGYPPSLTYNSEVDNTLLGFQIGGSSEYCLTQRLRFRAASKFGIFNNRINARQNVVNGGGVWATINNGTYTGNDYNVSDTKDDLAFLGELDFGLLFQRSRCSRFTVGYRAVGVSGVALAADQIPYDFSDLDQITRTNSNGSLLLHGGYAGLEFCY